MGSRPWLRCWAIEPDEARLGALLWQLVALAHEHNLNAEDSAARIRRAVSARTGGGYGPAKE